jgi:hypothetical protein
VEMTATGNCPQCGAWQGPGSSCPVCGRDYDVPLPPAAQQLAASAGPPIAVHTYRGRTQQEATVAFKEQAARLAARGYVPVSQSWAPGGRTAAASFFVVLGVLFLVLGLVLLPLWLFAIVFLIIGLVSGKGPGSLTVTYERR